MNCIVLNRVQNSNQPFLKLACLNRNNKFQTLQPFNFCASFFEPFFLYFLHRDRRLILHYRFQEVTRFPCFTVRNASGPFYEIKLLLHLEGKFVSGFIILKMHSYFIKSDLY